MARTYAQLCTLVFFIAGVGGWFLGTASTLANGIAQGNLGNLILHMTHTRDLVNDVLLVLFIYAAFFASRGAGKYIVLGGGVALTLLAVIGFVHGDNPTATQSVLDMNFPTTVNVFDAFFGIVGILASLGTLTDADIAAHENKSFLREG